LEKPNEASQPPSTTTGASNQPVKRSVIRYWNEDAQPSQDESVATISFAYWRGNYPGNKKPDGSR
jgi:hypothetical protein